MGHQRVVSVGPIGLQPGEIMGGEHRQEPLGDRMRRRQRQKGVTMVEYAIMLLLVAIAVAGAAPRIGDIVASIFSRTATCVNSVGSPC